MIMNDKQYVKNKNKIFEEAIQMVSIDNNSAKEKLFKYSLITIYKQKTMNSLIHELSSLVYRQIWMNHRINMKY